KLYLVGRRNMKFLRKEDGITLVETLAVFAISALIIILIIGVHVFVQKQFTTQSEDALHLTDITIAAKEITKKLRTDEIKKITEKSIEFNDGTVYEKVNDVLQKNGSEYIYNVKEFNIAEKEDIFANESKTANKIIILSIESITNQKIETEIT